ncbi:cation transporter, partial [Paracoccus sp. SY]|uniref:cation transporter n=1 Tax=Paracoccus sp. SY TaxID=1330255 RepID=UPI001EFCCC92
MKKRLQVGSKMAVETTERREWTVTGMDCAACTTKVTRAVERLPGVGDVKVAMMAERLTLTLEPNTTEPEIIEGIIRKLGFGIAPKGQQAPRKKAFV